MRELENRVTGADTEHRHQPHDTAERDADTGDRNREHTADHTERQVGHDQPAVASPVEGQKQDHQDQGQRQARVQHQFVTGLRLGFGRAGELDEHIRRQLHVPGDRLLRLLDDARQRAIVDVESDADTALAAIVLDAVPIFGGTDARDL